MSQSEKIELKEKHRKKKNEFIEDEAELSGDDEVSDDEPELSDDDQLLEGLVDLDAKELSSEEEEDVRRLFHKQMEADDKRQVLLMQEQLEENEIELGQRRRRKFRWQTREIMENSLKRHYDPDDEDSGSDDDYTPFQECAPRLKRPTADTILIRSTRLTPSKGTTISQSRVEYDDSTSQTFAQTTVSKANLSLSNFVFRDRTLVEAMSSKEVVVNTREERDRVIQRELKRVAQSKSIFDDLY